nr:class I SAM-dependent methyltransferase [Chryseolinea lacunae]
MADHRVIDVPDLGATSQALSGTKRKISAVARTSASPAKYSRLYARIIKAFDCHDVVELGTSLGINTQYLALGNDCAVTTFEGAEPIANIAEAGFEQAGARAITLVRGNIDHTLPRQLETLKRIDFALLDANHRHAPTLRYFETIARKVHSRSVLVIDDIHYSPEMARAWKDIQNHSLVYATADLFRCGLVFFDPSLNKQHVVLQH